MVYLCPKTSDGRVAYHEKDDWLVERVNELELALQTPQFEKENMINLVVNINDETLERVVRKVISDFLEAQTLQNGGVSPTDELGDGW